MERDPQGGRVLLGVVEWWYPREDGLYDVAHVTGEGFVLRIEEGVRGPCVLAGKPQDEGK